MESKPYFDSLFLRRLRRIITGVTRVKPLMSYKEISYTDEWHNMRGEEFQLYLQQRILDDKPLLLTRFGCGVILAAIDATNQPNIKNTLRYLLGYSDSLGVGYVTGCNLNAGDGFYPITQENVLRYGQLILDAIPKIDIIASIIHQERYFEKELENKVRCTFPDLEPFQWKNPWTYALEGKKVLVIHPFAKTIEKQYLENRENLFSDSKVLPFFELQTLRSVQPKMISDDPYDQYESWFDAFEFMKSEIKKRDFDVAILGCGAYGMPLSSYIFDLGKKAIHLGGGVQYLFGIRSARGDSLPEIAKHYNNFWVRPSEEERPSGFKKVEDGCYW